MSTPAEAALAARMAELTARFAAQAASTREALEVMVRDGDRAGLAALAHRLAGNAGMFGHADIGEAALALEEAAEADREVETAAARLLALLGRF